MTKRVGVVVLAIGVALGLSWWWQQEGRASESSNVPSAAKKGTAAKSGQAPAVEQAQARSEAYAPEATAIGTLLARRSTLIRSELSGRVVALGFQEGQAVRAGQMLVQLDDRLQRAEVMQAQAQQSVAQANRRRNDELVAQGFLAPRVAQESAAAEQVANAQVALAEARLERMRLVAPFAGVAGLSQVQVGDYVKEGSDLVRVDDLSALEVDFRLPERDMARVAIGQPVQLTVDAWPGVALSAHIRLVEPVIDEQGRSLGVRAVLDTVPRPALRPGAFVRVTVQFGAPVPAVWVPESAITPLQGQPHVYRLLAGDSKRAVEAVRTPVTLGVRRDAWVQVQEGVSAGDWVVVAGQQRLQGDRMPVRVVDLKQE